MFYLRAAVILGLTIAAVAMPASALLELLAPGLLVSAIVAVAALAADHAASSLGVGPQLQLAIVVAACGAAMLFGLRVTGAMLPRELKSLLASLLTRVPSGSARQMFGRALGL